MNVVMKRKCMHCGLVHYPYMSCQSVMEQDAADGRSFCPNPLCQIRHFFWEDCEQVRLQTIAELESIRDAIEKLTFEDVYGYPLSEDTTNTPNMGASSGVSHPDEDGQVGSDNSNT